MNRIATPDVQIVRLADAIAQRVGPQRFDVWFRKSARFDLRNDSLEIAVPNDFISDWIGTHFTRPIQEAACEVLGCSLPVKFAVMPQLFDGRDPEAAASAEAHARMMPVFAARADAAPATRHAAPMDESKMPVIGPRVMAHARSATPARPAVVTKPQARNPEVRTRGPQQAPVMRSVEEMNAAVRLRHDLESFVVGSSNQLAFNSCIEVADKPGGQYNPLFLHGGCGLGKTHLLHGLCKRFATQHPTKRWLYLTGEEFTNEYVTALRENRVDAFRRKMRALDLLVIDDVHFLGGKKSTQEEFLHTFNAIEATGRQVVMASDNHPKMIEAFTESLINRFISGMVVRVDPPNFATRCGILESLATRMRLSVRPEVMQWIAQRVTQNVRELEGALTRVAAITRLNNHAPASLELVQQGLGDLDREMHSPLRPEAIIHSVCEYFGLDEKDLRSGRRQRTISLARSVAMFLVRKNSRLSFPEIAQRLGKRNHSTVISACRRIQSAVDKNEKLEWTSSIGDREEEAQELVQRLEEQSRVRE